MPSYCQATDRDYNIPEYFFSASCLFQKKIRLDQINFITLAGKFILHMELAAARARIREKKKKKNTSP